MDMHMHTSISDGTDSPAELLSNVVKAGLDLFSVTDHDAIEACDAIGEIIAGYRSGSAAVSDDITSGENSAAGADPDSLPLFIPGVEFSCRDKDGKYHILGYNYRSDAKEIRNLTRWGHAIRQRKLSGRLAYLRDEYDFVFSKDDIKALKKLSNPGKPHIAILMVKYGYVKTKEEAIRNYLNKLKLKYPSLRPETAIERILESGGIPVLAHPSYGSGDQIIMGEEMEARLKKLIGYGLMGIEAYYSGFTPKLTGELLGFADRFDLCVTAGSDYHGVNKMIEPGEHNLPPADEWGDGVKKFLELIGV